MTPPHVYPGVAVSDPPSSSSCSSTLPQTTSSSSNSAKKRSISDRNLDEASLFGELTDMIDSNNFSIEEDFEAAHLLEQTKKLKMSQVKRVLDVMPQQNASAG